MVEGITWGNITVSNVLLEVPIMARYSFTVVFGLVAMSLFLASGVSEAQAESLQLHSSVIHEGDFIPRKYTCSADNINPPLDIQHVPKNAKSLALIVDDPDAPLGTWQHWLVWNISPETRTIAENSTPSGAVTGKNSKGNMGYYGPCPPFGTHRYYFRLYSLNDTLTLKPGSKRSDLDKAMEGHIIDKAELMGRFKK
jgi:Raf kinase inhibitor-like YbhB/YbcL family protein